MRLSIVIMAIVAVVWLGYQFWRLLSPSPPIWPTSPMGAVDLMQRHHEVYHWYTSPQQNTYYKVGTAVYPPATYTILAPLLWLTQPQARWIWMATTIPALIWLMAIVVRESGATGRLERTFIGMIPLSMYATGATIGNGQLNVHIMPLLITGLLVLSHDPPGWGRDIKGAALFVLSLIKPIIGGPFFWIVLFVRRSWRPVILIVGFYIALTLLALSFKELNSVQVIKSWFWRASGGVAFGSITGAVANQSTWLASLGLQGYILIYAALAGVMIMGIWMYLHRRVDPWLLLGVFGILSRLGIYHRWYDDLLILLPMIVLYRLARQGPASGGRDVIAGGLFGILLLIMLAPGGLYLLPWPWNRISTYVQIATWITTLFFLLNQAWRERRQKAAAAWRI